MTTPSLLTATTVAYEAREVYRSKYATGDERLTPHQREVYDRLARQSHGGQYWVFGTWFGCVGALDRLVAKGRAERALMFGPRGGWLYYYRVI